MIQALLLKCGLQGGLKLGRGVILALAIGALYATGGIGFWLGMETIERLQEQSAKAATDLADARNAAALEKSNAEAAAIIAARDVAAAKRDAVAVETISGLQTALTQWETRNAQVPGRKASGGRAQCFDAAELDDLNRLRGNPRPASAATPDRRR